MNGLYLEFYINKLSYLQFDQLKDCSHGSFLRHGGFDATDPSSLSKLQAELKIPSLVQCNQCHGNDVFLIESPSEFPTCDALITNKKNIGLMIKHADCQAALFYDPVKQAIGAAHSGWRGSVAKIYTKTIKAMHQHFGSKPEDLIVGISPFLGKEHAEFIHYKAEFPEEIWKYQIKPNYFDFAAIAMAELNYAGILSHHVNISTRCTFASPEDFYSYRREKSTGRHATVIALRDT